MHLPAVKRQSLLSLGSTVLITVVGFLSTMLFSHLLGKDLMGVYYLFLTYFSVFNLIGDGGFGTAAIKRIAEGHDENAYFSAYIFLRAILIVFSTLVLLAISPLFVDLAEYNMVPAVIVALIAAFFGHGITYGVQGLGHVGYYNTANGIAECVRVLVSVILVLLGFSVYGMIGGYVIGLLVVGAICLRHFKFKPAKFTKRHLQSLFAFSFWGLLIGSANLIMGYADAIFIGYFMTNGDVGVYRVAVQFTSVSLFIATAVSMVLAPKISNWSANGQLEMIPPMVARSITYGLILAVPTAIGGFLLSERMLYFFYGADFAEGAVVACINFVFQIVAVFLIIIGLALSNSDHVKNTFYGTLAAVILNVVLNIILIPMIGINGAAIGSLCALSLNLIIITHQLKRFMPVYFEKMPILHIVMASLVMGAFVLIYMLFVPLSNVFLTLVPVAIGAVIYFLLLFKIDKDIRDEVRGVVKNFGLPWPKWL